MKNIFKIITPRLKATQCALAAKRFRQDGRGAAALEAALIIPFLSVLIVGLADGYQAFSAQRALANVSNGMSDLVTRELEPIPSSDIQQLLDASTQLFQPFDGNELTVNIYAYRQTDSGTPEIAWSATRSNGVSTVDTSGLGAAPSGCNTTPLPDATTVSGLSTGEDVIIGQACFNWQPTFGSIFGLELLSNVLLTAENEYNPRNGTSILVF